MITISGIEVTGGHFYLGQRMKPAGHNSGGYYDGNNEASLVDDTLKIYPTPYIYEDSSLGYWPSFSSLSPEARGAYLSWLASDRCDTSCPIGYVFIYLYGLERRALVDSRDNNISDDEFYSLFKRSAVSDRFSMKTDLSGITHPSYLKRCPFFVRTKILQQLSTMIRSSAIACSSG